jgi:hypothetical protein
VIPVVITVYQDKSFTFITKSPPAAALLKRAAGIWPRARRAEPRQGRQGDAREQVPRDRPLKEKDLNAVDEDRARAWSKARRAAWASRWILRGNRDHGKARQKISGDQASKVDRQGV